MPGLAGFLKKYTSHDDPQNLDAMLNVMMHEEFYTRATYVNRKNGWYTGSVAIKESFADGMPIYNETHDLVLLLVGECFNGPQIITTLRSKGHEIDRHSANYLIHLYEEEGPSFVKKLNGWFSGIIIDTKRNTAVLFNDRYGIQRIYYHENTDGFYFSSEAKSLLKILPSLRNIDLQSVSEYLCFDCVLNNRTFFSKVQLLPAGSAWFFERGRYEKVSYFDPTDLENQSPLDARQFFDSFTDTFMEVLPRYIQGDKVGLALTAGLDTRLIMACLPKDRQEIKTLTFGGMYRDSTDVSLARKVSALCGLEHHTLRLGEDYLSNYPDHVARAVYITDGMVDATTADGLYLNNIARNIASSKLTGKFGGQVLGRVRPALRNRLPNETLINPDFKEHVFSVSESLAPYSEEHILSFILYKEIPWYWMRFTIPEMSQLMVRTPYLDNDLVPLFYRVPIEGFDGSAFEIEFITKFNPSLLSIRTNVGAGGKAPPLINKAIKLFYLTRAITEKTLNWDELPYSLHHIVTRIDSSILTPLHLDRIVLGSEFFRHYNRWFRNELISYLKETLLNERTFERPYWNRNYLIKIINDHEKGRGRYLSEIRKVLTLELIHRVLLENWV